MCGAFRLHAVVVAAGHGRFVGRNDFVGVAVFADLAIIDPDDAMTEAANLIKLVADEGDRANGTGDSPILPRHFFWKLMSPTARTSSTSKIQARDARPLQTPGELASRC